MTASTPPPRVYILRLLLKNLPDITDKSDHCEEYFNLITHLMKQSASSFKVESTENLLKLPFNRSFYSEDESF